MKNWLCRGILFLIVGLGGIISLQYAISHFKPDRQLILLNRTRPDFHHFSNIEKQGASVLSRGSLKEYFDYFQLVTDAMPGNSDGLLMLGYLEMITGNSPQAGNLLKEAYHLDPQFFFTEYNLALYYFNQGDYTQSTDLLQKALATTPDITLKYMVNSIIYRQLFSSLDDSNDIVIGLRQAYHDAYVLLVESLAKQRQLQGADVNIEVHAHIM